MFVDLPDSVDLSDFVVTPCNPVYINSEADPFQGYSVSLSFQERSELFWLVYATDGRWLEGLAEAREPTMAASDNRISEWGRDGRGDRPTQPMDFGLVGISAPMVDFAATPQAGIATFQNSSWHGLGHRIQRGDDRLDP